MSYDLLIIGGGPAGYVCANHAAHLGLKVAVVEQRKNLGGTCLNVGCIPSKALLNSSEHFHYAQHRFAAHGIKAGEISIDIPTMMARKEKVVNDLAKGIDFLFKKNQVERFEGTGKILNATTVEVSSPTGTQKLEAKNILLATGSVPIELPFMKFDGQSIVSSDQALSFPETPKSLLIIGAGAIGLELGSVWARLGTKITVVEFLPRVAAGFDAEVSTALQRSFEKQGMVFHLNTKVQAAKVGKNKVTVTAMKEGVEQTYEAEKVLVAVGRKPFTDGLGLEAAGVKLTDKARIAVDAHCKTSVDGIYAVGDVIDGPMLAHKAEAEGRALAERLAGKAAPVNYATIPNVVYTSPEAASVGLTEEQLKEKGTAYRVGKWTFMANGRAKAVDQTEGFVKLLADAKTDRILGVHIVSSNASELIAECVLAMEFSASAEDLARTIHAHPTMAEVIREAAELAQG
ncbi:MAG: dihydrolipoyl dehydrogenase [Candidatus Methylacidiphilales bacterium]|nr:dihydrolipoyl dehydrogenase [Candidatus Methylacidiphilales bacterium]